MSMQLQNWARMNFLVLLIGCPMAWGRTLIVGAPNTPCPNAGYSTIGAAIAAAKSGDVIDICPATYAEQLVIAMPLTLVGVAQQGIGRVLIQPSMLTSPTPAPSGYLAVISVVNTNNVTISNLAIDASANTVSGCTPELAGIHFYNASGVVDEVAISGTQLTEPTSCTKLFPGNGFGVLADEASTATGTYNITVRNSSIHDFGRNGVLVTGSGENANVNSNSIAGVGPSTGVNQFGVFVANGATGQITANNISQGTCGNIPIDESSTTGCYSLRSEGVVLRSAGNGVLIAGNVITNVQSGIFVNGATKPIVSANTISNVDALDAIHMQGSVSGLYTANRIFHVGPFTTDTSNNEEGCGINDISGTGSSDNTIFGNWINDAYCGVAYVTSDRVNDNIFLNTLYETLNGDNYPSTFPPPTEP